MKPKIETRVAGVLMSLNRSDVSLLAGLIVGLACAVYAVLDPEWDALENEGAVAVINGSSISEDKYLSHLSSYGTDKRGALSEQDKRFVLQRIIDEELLIQRGVEVGLLVNDKRSRAALINAMIEMATVEAQATQPKQAVLKAFYEDNQAYFNAAKSLRVGQLLISDHDQALSAYQQLIQGQSLKRVRSQFEDQSVVIIPDVLMPAVKLREYIGPSAAALLSRQSAGYVMPPTQQGQAYRIVQLLQLKRDQVQVFSAVKPQVEVEYRRRQADKALRDYLAWLKTRAAIQQQPTLPSLKADKLSKP